MIIYNRKVTCCAAYSKQNEIITVPLVSGFAKAQVDSLCYSGSYYI